MNNGFRKAVFNLCNALNNNPFSAKIRETVKSIHSIEQSRNSIENDKTAIMGRPIHGDLGSIASDQKAQFLGYLLADDAVEDINQKEIFFATHLTSEEREIIEIAHQTIEYFIDSCISDLRLKYPKVSILLDPYFQYKRPVISKHIRPFLEDEDIKECVDTFRSGKIYEQLISNNTLCYLENVNDEAIRTLAFVQQKQFTEDFLVISESTKEMVNKVIPKRKNSLPELLSLYSALCYSLRRTLMIASQMIYESICGYKMLIMNNDNIINIEKNEKNTVYEKQVVLLQEDLFLQNKGNVGSVALLVCELGNGTCINQFGVIFAQTVSYHKDYGTTSKITIVDIDDDINEIHTLTDSILRKTAIVN